MKFIKLKDTWTNPTKCQLCKKLTMVDVHGNGDCNHCGWSQSEDAVHNANIVRYPNRVPYSKAIQLYKAGKPFEPDFEDFVGMLKFYSEVEFYLDGIKYGVVYLGEDGVELFQDGTENYTRYKDYEDFERTAGINGALLKDLWSKVKNPYWLT